MDKVTQVNPITGSLLSTKPSSEAYREGYDRIFSKREHKKQIILLNQAQCNNCFDIITSKHRHDYVTCSCGNLSVDGGLDYTKRKFGDKGYSDISVYADEDDIKTIREYFSWASYGPNGDQPKHYLLLKDLTSEHLQDILETQQHIKGTYVEDFFKMELEYRKEHNLE